MKLIALTLMLVTLPRTAHFSIGAKAHGVFLEHPAGISLSGADHQVPIRILPDDTACFVVRLAGLPEAPLVTRPDPVALGLRPLLQVVDWHERTEISLIEDSSRHAEVTHESPVAITLAPIRSDDPRWLMGADGLPLPGMSMGETCLQSRTDIRTDVWLALGVPARALVGSTLVHPLPNGQREALLAFSAPLLLGVGPEPESVADAELDARAISARYQRARRLEDAVEALRWIDATLAQTPDSAGMHGLRARSLLDLGRPREALEAMREAIATCEAKGGCFQGELPPIEWRHFVSRLESTLSDDAASDARRATSP